MNVELSIYEKSVIIRAILKLKQEVEGYIEMTDEDKELLKSFHKDLSKIIKKLS